MSNLAIVILQIVLLEEFLSVVGRLIGIAGKKPLVQPLLGIEHRVTTKNDLKEFELRGHTGPTLRRHTVSGVDSTRPTGPHSHAQKIAATMIASGERPVREP